MKQRKKLNKGSAGQNRKTGEAYIAKYAQHSDVVETGSGLLYRVLERAEGLCPQVHDMVTVNQRILNVDGSVITDTYKNGIADTFSMTEALPGLREGLMMMPTGARYEFVIPPELAWGKRGAGNKIGPNAVLIFDVRLLEVQIT